MTASPPKRDFFQTLQDQIRIRLQYGPEFIGDLAQIEVGLTPRQAIYTEGSHVLYHYPSQTNRQIPILLVYSLINRPYIFDLRPGRSLIEFLTQEGFDVYLLDWGDPTPEMAHAGLGDLVAGTLRRCAAKVRRRHKIAQLNILGYCMGATFATLYAGLEPQRVERLILLTPMLGKDREGVLQTIIEHQSLAPDLLESQLVSGRQLKWFFNAIRPVTVLKKERDFWQNYDQELFLDHFLPVEKWSNDTPDLPGRAFQEFIQFCIIEDQLRQGQISLAGHLVDLAQITCPVLAVAAKHDWIIPASALETGAEVFTQAEYTPYLLNGGHIGLVVGRSAGKLWGDLKRFLLGQPFVVN